MINDNIYIEQNEFIAGCIPSDMNKKLGLQYVQAVLVTPSLPKNSPLKGKDEQTYS